MFLFPIKILIDSTVGVILTIAEFSHASDLGDEVLFSTPVNFFLIQPMRDMMQ